jgi:hypothetical protein
MNDTKIIKRILPLSHGSWAFVLEPLILALWVSWSFNGFILSFGAVFAFLAHQPLRSLVIQGYQKSVLIFSLIFIFLAAVFIIFFMVNSSFYPNLLLSIAFLLMIIFLFMDLSGNTKSLIAEILVPIAISVMATVVFITKKGSFLYSAAFFVLLLTRSLPTIYYVRAQVRIIKGKNYDNKSLVLSHMLSFLMILVFVYGKLIPGLALIPITLLLLRCCIFILPMKNYLSIKQLGASEFLFGILFVVISGLAYSL